MKLIAIIFSINTFPILLAYCHTILGVPVPDTENSNEISNSTNDQPVEEQPFPFKEFQNESANYLVVDDMIINKEDARAGLVEYAWPGGVVPYSFQYTIGVPQRNELLQAMKEISEVSCIQFRTVQKEDTYSLEYRNDPRSKSCSSFVGWQNRKNQPIQLSNICSKGNAIHEIIHALGFFHEHTRNDRDDYVVINYQNIQPGYENNFKKDSDLTGSETDYFGVSYNYDSIMHYGKDYFTKNKENTIDVKNPPSGNSAPMGNPENLGQRSFISQGDIIMLNKKYNCDFDPESVSGSTPENSEGEDSSTKPTTKNPMCQINPTMPICKQ